MPENAFRRLPSVDIVLRALDGGEVPRAFAVEAVRAVLADARQAAAAGISPPGVEDLASRAQSLIETARRDSLRRVINATGVILQTNLGRAPLSARALAAAVSASRGYSNLEFDLASGGRGSRHDHVRGLIRRTTGAEDGLVLNNNAAALFMVIQVFAKGREVVVSRGQAVEIGGGFRIPDVLREGGATLVEVGTTNRTYVADYASAITPETAAILRVHPSNFRVAGFTAEASLAGLASLAREREVLLVDDLGSGCLLDTARFGMAHEPTVQESIAAGADLALFSGDKLLGGPQAGIVAGKAALIAELRRHPLARALRVDRMTIAALNATLAAYAEGTAIEELPAWRMIAAPPASMRRRARRWASVAPAVASVVAARSMVGGGAAPGEGVPTWCCALNGSIGATELAARLRGFEPPVIARIEDGRVLLDPRTVEEDDDATVALAIASAVEVTIVT